MSSFKSNENIHASFKSNENSNEKCLVNGEILSTWWIYTHSFTVAASQIIGKYGEL